MDRQAEGADEAITALYRAHWDHLVRLAWLLLHDQHAAEDVVQDAYISTHRQWARIRDTGRVVGYLRTAVVNGCRSVQRRLAVADREHRRAATSSATAASFGAAGWAASESAETDALRSRERASLLCAINSLPGRQREVVVLRFYGDLSEAQIARSLGISRGAVKSHAHRGLKALRRALGHQDPLSEGEPTHADRPVPNLPAPVWRSNSREPS
jgi:RNA polymerase sigma-70 factor (sigma-E family)